VLHFSCGPASCCSIPTQPAGCYTYILEAVLAGQFASQERGGSRHTTRAQEHGEEACSWRRRPEGDRVAAYNNEGHERCSQCSLLHAIRDISDYRADYTANDVHRYREIVDLDILVSTSGVLVTVVQREQDSERHIP
jgi:hypothetical protein